MTESDKHRIIKLNIEYLKPDGKAARVVKSKIRRILKRNGLI